MPVVFLIYKLGIQPYYEAALKNNGKKSIATIRDVRLKSISFDFHANGTIISSTTGRSEIPSVMCRYLKIGEKFEIQFDSLNPYNNEIDLCKPIMDSTFMVTNGFNIKSVSNRIIEFQYFVDQSVYTRYQMINDKNFKIKKTHQVFYKKRKPEVAYIVFE